MRKPRFSRPFQIIALLIMFSLLTWSLAYAIAVDGENTSNEWDTINWDISGETNETDIPDYWDIQGIKLACSTTNIYYLLSTHSAPSFSGDEIANVYLDTDQNLTNGCTGPGGTIGFERRIRAYATGEVRVQTCTPPSTWTTNDTTGAVAAGSYVEFNAPLTALGMTCPYGGRLNLNYLVFYDNGDDPPDDLVPNAGTKNLIDLAALAATSQDGGVHVAWETASEVDNAGFNVYRAEAADGEYAQLNDALIVAQGGPTQGAAYAFDDAGVSAGTTYYYKIEDVDVYGVSTFHGPVSVTIDEMPTAVKVLGFHAGGVPVLPFALVLGGLGLVWVWRRKKR